MCVFAESLMTLENRVDAQLSSSAARFFVFFSEAVTSARSPGTGAFVPRTPPSRARDVTHAPLTSAAERATGQTRAHRRISKGGWVGVQKQNSRSKLCASAPGLPDVPKCSVGNRRRWFWLTGASRRRLSPPNTPPLFSSAAWGQ